MKNKFLKLYSGNKDIVKNFSYLAILQVFNLAVPLITLPYLITVLGKENYGLIVFSQTLVSYFLILINFGFNIIATKEVSQHRDDKKMLSEVVSSVFIIKGIFFIISFVILLTLLPLFSDERLKYLLIFMMYLCFYEWIFPVWYFQGKEEMKYITIVNLISRVIFLILIFFVVKNEQDFLKVPIINGTGCFFAGLVSIWLVFKKDEIKFKFQKISVLKKYVIESYPLFLGNIAGKIKILSNKTVLGALVGMESVAIYDIVDKIKDVFIYFLQLIVPVLFPNVVKNKNGNIIKKAAKLLLYSGLLIYLGVGIILLFVFHFYYTSYSDVSYLFLILGLLVILQPVSYLIGTCVLLVNNLKKPYAINLYVSTFLYLLLVGGFYLFDSINEYSLSLALVLSACMGLFLNLRVSKRNNKLDWIL